MIRLGYACICNSIEEHMHTITYTNYLKDKNKINDIVKQNFEVLKKILTYNNKNNIHFYRLSSNFIPCASIIEYDYPNIFKKEFKEISKLIKGRFDMHLSEYCILNSTNKEVVERSIDEIKYHYKLLKCFKVKPNLIIHIGSKSFGKENSITRFINNFNKLPNYLKNTLLIENDDKVFNVEDTLRLCQKIKRPMVLDVHHHNCNKTEKDLSNYLNEIFNTWDTTPKIHFSSPKNKKDFRAHNDYINSDDFINFIKLIDRDIDVMLEAKAKDDALFRLVRELKYKTNYIFLDETTIKKDL